MVVEAVEDALPYRAMAIDDIVKLSIELEELITAHRDYQEEFVPSQFERAEKARKDLMSTVRQRIRKYKGCVDPDGFLRRLEDFKPIKSEIPELEALSHAVLATHEKDRVHMRMMVTSNDGQALAETLERTRGLTPLASEWELLTEHFKGVRRVAEGNMRILLDEKHPGKVMDPQQLESKFACFGDSLRPLILKVNKHRKALLDEATRKMRRVMEAERGPNDVRAVLQAYHDFPRELNHVRALLGKYLERLQDSLSERVDNLLVGMAIAPIDELLTRQSRMRELELSAAADADAASHDATDEVAASTDATASESKEGKE